MPLSDRQGDKRTAEACKQHDYLRSPFWPVETTVARNLLVSWCFKPSQPLRIISGLEETFIKRYVVERINKATTTTTTKKTPEEQSEKAEICRKNLRNEIQPKGP